jgi:ATP-dependent Lhr-like helicase
VVNSFSRFPPRLQEAIVSRLGWTRLRPVQEEAGAALLDGDNAVILAPTAGGKTEASIFPTLAMLLDQPADTVGALYIAPIKALLNNQDERLGTYTEMVGLRRFVWHGDTTTSQKKRFLREPCELLMTTPESLEVMLVSSAVPVTKLFRNLRIVIVDEVHAFAGTDRGAHFLSVLERLAQYTENDIQRAGLSATVGNPDAILRWLTGSSKRSGQIIDPPKKPARRKLAVSLCLSIAHIATAASAEAVGHKSLFFCESRSLTEAVAQRMRVRDIGIFVHHSSVSKEERADAERNFHQGSNVSIACTSTLELGIDVGDLDKVFQANAPSTVSSFLQRMGRTGRREGSVANTSFFVEDFETGLQAIALIELAKSGWVESVAELTRCWPVMLHQLLAMTLQYGAISAETAWQHLSRIKDLSGISRDEYNQLIEHLLCENFLYETSGQLVMGDKAERVYGRKNFMELYAVFSSPVRYHVLTTQKQEIGTLEQNFVDSLVNNVSAFLLGGRAWVAEHVNHSDRTVRVKPAPGGRRPSWGGFVPQHLSFELCQQMRKILTDDCEYSYINQTLASALQDKRDELGEILRESVLPIQLDHEKGHAWTFAGGRINQTLRYIFALEGGFKVTPDNVQLRMEGDTVTLPRVHKVIDRMRQPEFWSDRTVWDSIIAALPEYRLSKFQRALPPQFSEEMVRDYLLDIKGTQRMIDTV